MKKLLIFLLSSTLCFNNAFLTVQALEDDPVPSEEPTEEVKEESVPEEPLVTDEPEVIETEPEVQINNDSESEEFRKGSK